MPLPASETVHEIALLYAEILSLCETSSKASLSGILLLVLFFCEASSKVCFSVCNLIPGCVHVDWEQDYLYVVFTTILVWVILIKPCNKNGHSLIQGLCSMESKRIGSSPRVHRMEVEHRI